MMLTREGIAYRIARDLPEGGYVNLGVGIPLLVANFLDPAKEIFIHSENGILGVGPTPARGEEDLDIVSAGAGFCTLALGASLFDHTLSFTMIRGGHLTHAILGAIEVAASGDFANWRVPGQAVPAVGGAMDLAVGAPNVYVAMSHLTNKGKPKIVKSCSAPLTARACVRRIYTDLAIIDVEAGGLVLRELMPGHDPAGIQAKTEAELKVAADCREIDVPETFNGARLRQ
ncbi:MAG: 3-oxoacid CoA-transferase subunit B [Betaproteobacteria bacterium]|nr:3-oxoacid CoA-transferase subunit B [Betaproteobacteria bacterium]